MIRCITSEPHKLIFLWSPKAGSSTAKNIFYDYVGVKLPHEGWLVNDEKWKKENSLEQYNYPPNPSQYLKIQFVRNPYERAVSSFLHHLDTRPQHKCKPYDNFIDFLLNLRKKQISCEGCKFHSINQYMTNDINDFVKIENLHKELIRINDKYNLELKWLTCETHSYRAGLRKVNFVVKHYSEYLTPKAINLINQIYAKDIEYFGYQFQHPFKLI